MAPVFTPLGAHLVNVDGDSIFFVARGAVTVEDMAKLLDIFEAVRLEYAQVFVLYDSRENTSMEPAARRLATVHRTGTTAVDLHVSFGAPFAIRVLVGMINRAASFMSKSRPIVQLFETEPEARRYFDAERARLRAARQVAQSA